MKYIDIRAHLLRYDFSTMGHLSPNFVSSSTSTLLAAFKLALSHSDELTLASLNREKSKANAVNTAATVRDDKVEFLTGYGKTLIMILTLVAWVLILEGLGSLLFLNL